LDIDFEITLEDMVEFNLYVLTHQNPFKRNIRFSKVFSICAMVFCAVLGVSNIFLSKDMVVTFIFFCCVLLIIFIYWFLFNSKRYKDRVRKAIKKHYPRIPNEEMCRHKITISEEGLLDSTDYGNSIQNWSAFDSIVKTDQYIYLFLRIAKGYLIPKRAFSDDASFSLFAEKAMNYKSNISK
jgi:hypothetical protein